MQFPSKIVPCLWFDRNGEDAARFYVGVFPGARIVNVSRFPDAGQEVHGQPAGLAMTVEFELAGQRFTALNGGPQFRFTEAVSLQVLCDDQAEVDHFWSKLSEGGPVEAQQCGWVKDRFGLSWQVVPRALVEMMTDSDPAKVKRTFEAMLRMKKLEIAALRAAFEGR